MAATPPIYRAITSTNEVYDDPSEDLLFILFQDIEAGAAEYFVVERLSDPSGQTYVQTIRNDDGSWAVEYRHGGPEDHHRAEFAEMRAAHEVLFRWLFELPGWEAAPWEKLEFD